MARLEHRAILESLADIEALAPGLYEMKIDNPSGDPDCHKPSYSIRFEPRQVQDLKTDYPQEAFERVKQVSTVNEALYRAFVSPWAQALATPWTAEMLKWLHPMRTSRYLLSEAFSPWMRGVALLAESLSKNRQPLAQNHPFIKREREAVGEVTHAMGQLREGRDAAREQAFRLMFQNPDLFSSVLSMMGKKVGDGNLGRPNSVSVLDVKDDQVVKTVPVGKTPNGISVTP